MLNVAQTQAVVKTAVVYNRQAKQWEARNGKIHTFPAGRDGKRAALLCALEHDHPALHRTVAGQIAKHGQQHADRLIRAAQLLTKGRVHADGRVCSQTDPDACYQTTYNLVYRCECPDHDSGRAPWSPMSPATCKHVWAVWLAWALDWPLEAPPAPSPDFDRVAQRKAQDWADQLADRQARDTALPASVDRTDSLEDYLGYDPAPALPDRIELDAAAREAIRRSSEKVAANAGLYEAALKPDPINRNAGRPDFNNPWRYR